MRILIVTSSMDDGGVARIVSELTLLLPKDWQFDILLTHSDDIRYEYNGRIIDLGIREPANRKNLAYVARVFLKRMRFLRNLKKSGNYDACISFMDSGNIANILSGNRYCKTVITIECHLSIQARYDRKFKFVVNPIARILYDRADQIIACSDESASDLIKNFKISANKIKRIYCSIDTREVSRCMTENAIPASESNWFDKNKTIITAGRLSIQKGQWHLIQAFKKVLEEIPDAKLVVFGDGELKDYLNMLIKYSRLEDSVLLHSYSKLLPMYLAESAVFVMPSLYEGFPTAMLMAFSCGIACVADDFTSGAREQLAPGYKDDITTYIEGEYGLISAALDDYLPQSDELLTAGETNLAESIIHVLSDDTLRAKYKRKAHERSKDFDSQTICKEWENTILELCRAV